MKAGWEKRKIGRRFLAVVLAICMLFTVQPNLWDGIMVQAAEKVESGADFVMQTLFERIAALPDAEEYLALEPDEDDEDAYTEWEDTLYEYAEEARAIWGEYEALTGEQQAQISEEEMARLTAWLEIAETLSDNNAVMLAGYSEHHGESNWTALTASDTTLTNGKYYLSGDIEMGTITINGGDVTLCLNGHKVQHNGTDGSVIVVGSGTFTLCDCQDHWGYTSSFDEDTKTYSCEMTGTGGCITGGRGTENDIGNICGGGIFVRSGATFNMNSGRITGCGVGTGVKLYGGGVYVTGGTFNMSGGFLDGNMANCGGGVYIENKAGFTMSGNATVMNNEGDAGGGVYILDGTFNMTSGNILGNKGGGYGGGAIMVGGGTSESPASFIMSGGMIEGNTIKDAVQSITAGIYCNGGTLILSEGSIQHNIGNTEAAGGIRMLAGTLEVSGNIRISDNYGWNGVNNLSLARNCTITVTGELSNDIGVTYRPARGTVSYPLLVVKGTNSYSISDADWSHFSSDNEKYEIQKKETTDTGNELYLAEPGTCDLFTLSTSGATLSPEFKSDTIEYTSEVANSVDQVGITATLADTASGADITIKINDGTTEEMENGVLKTVNLAEGENTIVITVTSGEMSKAYTIKITREIQETPTEYKVTLNGNGGSAGTALTSYTYGTKVTLPTDWTKTGYTFAGWYDNENCTGTEVKEISATATGDKEYWASWTPISYSISYDLDGGAVTGNPTEYTIESSAITLINPTKAGYSFGGWSGTDLTGSNNMSVTIASGSTGNRTYTAHWDVKGYTVTLHTNGGTGGTDLTSYKFGTGAVLPTNWTKTGYVFDGWYDNENCTGTAVTSISAADTGNKEYWAKWTDNTAPVIGTLTYNYEPKNLWHWLIGKDSLVITVPVTEEGSGADKIDYNVTPEGGTESKKTAVIRNGVAEITVSADFKGTVSVTCTDKAGNISAGVTVGAGVAQNGIIIEDNAPELAFRAENAELLPSGEYKTAPDIVVTVADDKDNAISAGIAAVSYKIGDGSVKTVQHDYTTSMVVSDSFTIPAGEITAGGIPADGAVISVTATDNAGNSVTQTYTVKIHTHSVRQSVPETPADCTKAGNKAYYICSCGKWFTDSGCTDEITDKTTVVIDAPGHDFTGKYTFDKDGHWKECSRCVETSAKEPHQFEADGTHCTKCEFEQAGEGHTHSIEETVPEKAATCTEAGRKAYYKCSCGSWFFDSSCTDEITEQSEVVIDALGHDFVTEHGPDGHWQACTRCRMEQAGGPHVYDNDTDTECNVCGYVRTLQGHTHSGTLVAANPATCTQDGNKAYYKCSCGKWFSDSACTSEVTEQDVAIRAKGHTAAMDAAKAATCTETGLTGGSHCSACGHVIKAQTVTAALGHDFGGTYQHDEKHHWKPCSRCGETQPKAEHIYDSDTDRACSVCGYERTMENPPGETGTVSKDVEKDEKAPDTTLSTGKEELADIILTEEEKAQVENGTDIRFILDVKDAGDTVSSGDRAAVRETLNGNSEVKGYVVGQYLDISLFKVIGADRSAISETAKKLTIVIDVPDSLKSKDSLEPRTYAIIRVHGGVAETLEDLDDDAGTVTIATDRFSAYVIVYHEAGGGADVMPTPTASPGPTPTVSPGPTPTAGPLPTPTVSPLPTPTASLEPTPTEKTSRSEQSKTELHSGLQAVQTGKKLQISWGRVTGADGYSVYVQYCGKDFGARSLNQVKSGKKTKITVSRVNGKKLDTTKNFKLYVVAWKWKNGKKSTLAKTLTIHIAGKDSVQYTNVKNIRVKKTSYTLKTGDIITLHPEAVLYDKRKKQLSVEHTQEFRYLGSDKKVATVTAGGKVKAKGRGSCTVYVFAKNGFKRMIKIKV